MIFKILKNQKLKEVITSIKKSLIDDGSLLVRKSGTDNLLRIMVQSKSNSKVAKGRVNEVTKEGYIDPKNNTIDYALLFVPVEGIFQFIVENELELTNGKIDIYNEAIEKNIIM